MNNKPTLKTALTQYGLTMVVIGSCIGSGIFITPSDIAKAVLDPTAMLGAWTVGGIMALTGALTFAELGGLFKRTGGVYVFMKEAYGNWLGFLYGWAVLTVITSGAIAALCLACTQYLAYLILIPEGMETLVAAGLIVIVTFVNIVGVNMGQLFSNFFTGIKIAGILAVVAVGLYFGAAATNWSPDIIKVAVPPSGFALALIGVFWSYGGWHHATYLAGEAKNPHRTIPRAMIIGTLAVTGIYLLTNLAYLYLMPIGEIAASKSLAADMVGMIFPAGGLMVAAIIAASTFGTAGIYTLSAPRIYFAMAKDKLFFQVFSRIHGKYQTPVAAIALQSGWAIVLLLFWGTFNNLISYVVFTEWIFLVLATASVFVFRRKLPNAERPYKTFAYPIVPLIFIGISVWFIAKMLISEPLNAVAGLALLAVGSIVYLLFRSAQKQPPGDPSSDVLDLPE